ncbi:MAG: aldehyde ferredoxin oxidoreductase C-terminal domain-containing protein [bacterium]
MGTQYGGYMGRILEIDLAQLIFKDYSVSDRDREKFLGGKTLAAKILYDELEPGTDALSPENIIVFMTGPLTGSGAPCTSRFDVSTKNVMTGGIASSNCGGTFGMYLKKAGYDGLILRGRAERPTTLVINEEGIEFKDARPLWGKNTEETQHALEKKFGKKCGLAVIGPAGENLVRYASIISGERAAGRCGAGAVLGSKNIKALVAYGAKNIPIHDEPGFRKAVKGWVDTLRKNPSTGERLPNFGTAGLVSVANAAGVLPTHNFSKGSFDSAETISGEEMTEKHSAGNSGCVSCPIRCERRVRHEGRVIKGPEFETVGMFGPDIDNPDMAKIIEWNYQLDLLGMDTITAGSTIAFAMELNEKGLWKNGLTFGDTGIIAGILDDIAYRRGIGDELAEGSMRVAARHGGADFAMHTKGMEFAAYEPRRAVGHGLGYATSNRGGCHINGGYLVFFEALGPVLMDPLTTKAKPEFCVFQQNMLEAVSACGNCIFTTYALIPGIASKLVPPASNAAKVVSDILIGSGALLHNQGAALREWMIPLHVPMIPHTETISTLTGMNMDLGHFASAGERGFTLERIFNLREGIGAPDDTLPARLTDVPQDPDRPETRVRIDVMMPVYYEVRDWDGDGIPTKRLAKKLGLDFTGPALNDIRERASEMANDRRKHIAAEAEFFESIYKKQIEERDEIEANIAEITRAADEDEQKAKVAMLRGSKFEINPVRCRSCGLCFKACPADAIIWTKGVPARIDSAKCVVCGKCFEACPRNFSSVKCEDSGEIKIRKSGMMVEIDPELCKSCGICSRKCPTQAIVWEKKQPASIEQRYCVKCTACRIACPDKFNAIRLNGDLKTVVLKSGEAASE